MSQPLDMSLLAPAQNAARSQEQDMSQPLDMSLLAPAQNAARSQEQTVKKRRTEIEINFRKEAATVRKTLIDTLRPIQKDVFQSLESNEQSSLVIIPTGSGKTLLMSVLACKTKCSIVFAPYTLLKKELYAVLNGKGATHWWPLPDDSESIDSILCNANYILMSYEAAPTCASLLLAFHRLNRLGPIFVDEVCRPIWLQNRYVTMM